MINAMHWTATRAGLPTDTLLLDIVKSWDRKAFRTDGMLPSFGPELFWAYCHVTSKCCTCRLVEQSLHQAYHQLTDLQLQT